jgi:hypothetical protein
MGNRRQYRGQSMFDLPDTRINPGELVGSPAFKAMADRMSNPTTQISNWEYGRRMYELHGRGVVGHLPHERVAYYLVSAEILSDRDRALCAMYKPDKQVIVRNGDGTFIADKGTRYALQEWSYDVGAKSPSPHDWVVSD